MDFTLKTFNLLIKILQKKGFSFYKFSDFLSNPSGKAIILRHDVDQLPINSFRFAKIEREIGISGTYYFRVNSKSWDERIIEEIALLGHEVGYHYEDMSLAQAKHKAQGSRFKVHGEELKRKLAEIGIKSFEENLGKFRRIVPVTTICMHGNPMSKWDNRLLWNYYDYHDFGIIGEPYFDINFDEVFYLTDTGRRWDGTSVNIRDKEFNRKELKVIAKGSKKKLSPSTPLSLPFSLKFHSTFDLIKAVEEANLPEKIMMTFHPQRWTDKPIPWTQELIWQNVKNVAKYFNMKFRK
jgi:hypothetical protein